MKIRIKGIYHERTEDAPFIGALICANDCKFCCPDCINEDIKKSAGFDMEDTNIIKNVKSNPFNHGIILAGLEWTLQSKEMFRLIDLAIENNLEVILYTGMDKESLFNKFPELIKKRLYIKCGRYDKNLRVNEYKMHGVYLASSNQEIIKLNGEIMRDKIYFAKMFEDVKIPTKRDEDGAYDIYAHFDGDCLQIRPHYIKVVNTGLISAFDKKYRIVLHERGSTGIVGLKVNAGLIDSGYRGEWKVILNNTTDKTIYIDKAYTKVKEDECSVRYPYSKAIAQAKVEIVPEVTIEEISQEEIVGIESQRGTGLLGSSGK